MNWTSVKSFVLDRFRWDCFRLEIVNLSSARDLKSEGKRLKAVTIFSGHSFFHWTPELQRARYTLIYKTYRTLISLCPDQFRNMVGRYPMRSPAMYLRIPFKNHSVIWYFRGTCRVPRYHRPGKPTNDKRQVPGRDPVRSCLFHVNVIFFQSDLLRSILF